MSRQLKRLRGCRNESSRTSFIERALTSSSDGRLTLLDVGAGNMPYRSLAEALGYTYRSHDFAQYDGLGDGSGLQSGDWRTSGHDLVCDILEIPTKEVFDVVLCTEVLEHVPDPVRSFSKLAELTRTGGVVIVTVPFLSLMHQAPYWFQSGLSPYWFDYWANRFDLVPVELAVAGDYADLMSQELGRVASALPRSRALLFRFSVGLLARGLRGFASEELLASGGFHTFFIGQKT